ncbi:MAG: hypothetical protein L6Q92_10765 [Phycisphaerae bacterium]|nr:hypothetical protein [Phycisphaerae bacterium]
MLGVQLLCEQLLGLLDLLLTILTPLFGQIGLPVPTFSAICALIPV